MSVSDFEAVIRKRPRNFECVFACTHFRVCVCAHHNARAEHKSRNDQGQPSFHFGGSLLSISVISLPTASFIFRTSSTVGTLSSGNETSFSIPVSCSLTCLTKSSWRNSGEISFTFDCKKRTKAGCHTALAADSL